MDTRKQRIGRWGEELAVEYLKSQGLVVLDRNLRTPYGELDILAQDGDTLVFVEVKTRTSRNYGYPEEAVTALKKLHIVNSIESVYQNKPDLTKDWRVDVVSIVKLPGQDPEIVWFQNALE